MQVNASFRRMIDQEIDEMTRRSKNCTYGNPDCKRCNPDGPSEHDHDVINRAKNNADAPYDQATCATYPWAAAARIRFLEQRDDEEHDNLFAERAALRAAMFACLPYVPEDRTSVWELVQEAIKPIGQHGKG